MLDVALCRDEVPTFSSCKHVVVKEEIVWEPNREVVSPLLWEVFSEDQVAPRPVPVPEDRNSAGEEHPRDTLRVRVEVVEEADNLDPGGDVVQVSDQLHSGFKPALGVDNVVVCDNDDVSSGVVEPEVVGVGDSFGLVWVGDDLDEEPVLRSMEGLT